MRIILFFLIVCTCVCDGLGQEQSADTLILTHVNVVDTRHGGLLPDRVVVVHGGLIQAIGKLGLISPSRHVHIISAAGAYMIPGLWDMQVDLGRNPHWNDSAIFPLYVANGVVGIRAVGDPALLRQQSERIELGDLLGPHIVFARSISSAENANMGRDSDLALAAQSSKAQLPLDGFVPDSVRITEVSHAGQHSIERLSGVSLACSSKEEKLREEALNASARQDRGSYASIMERAAATYDSAKAWKIFTQLADNNTWQVPSLVWSQASAGGSRAPDDETKYIPLSVRSQWENLRNRNSVPQEEADHELALVNTMRRAGVQFMTGTDGPAQNDLPGFSIHDELELLVKSGFTPLQALQTATFNPALFLVKLDRYGVVETGHAADLVLLEGNPLEDIRNTRRVSGVILRGKYYSRKDLDGTLAAVADVCREPINNAEKSGPPERTAENQP
jgi:hypothetical protein